MASADPATPAYSDTLEWITAYLAIHSLSAPSQRYALLLWLVIVFMLVVFTVLHWSGSRSSFLGAVWSKWSLRRRTWRKKHTLALAQRTNQTHRQPTSLPSNAQLLSLFVLLLVSLTLAFVGPDYLDPSLKVFQFRARSYDTSEFEADMPQYTISKSLWSSSARTGQIAFALLPLCVLFAVKAPPFAIFAIPFMIQLHFDKLAYLHKWAGRLIWFLVSIHVVLWSIQLAKDVNSSTGRVAYVYAWSYTPFIYGWIAFALLTLVILLSLRPIRRRFYESFYILHLLLVPSMLVMAGLHHPTVAWWCLAALVIWIGERLWRGTWWIYVNGIVGRTTHVPPPVPSDFKDSPRDEWEMHHVKHFSDESNPARRLSDGRSPSPLESYYHSEKGDASHNRRSIASLAASVSLSAEHHSSGSSYFHSQHPYIPPFGYVHAEILSGRTVRLRLITPGFLPWSPGQHFLLNIPSVSRFTSHPFTCASVCDEAAPTDAGRMMLFLVRTKSGWTQDLWNLVSQLTAEHSRGDVSPTFPSDSLPKHGVLLRAFVDGPFGSAARAKWGNHSTGIIIAGGSGVSFGLSILQYMCLCLAGRDEKQLGRRFESLQWNGGLLKRIRFIWLIREYSHIQWCASVIRHCMSIVPSSALQVDIYVTRFNPISLRNVLTSPSRVHFDREAVESDDELQPPHPNFIRERPGHSRSRSNDSTDSRESFESDVDLSYYLGENLADEPPPDDLRRAHEEHILDLTNFDGDVDIASPGEAHFSRKVKKEGKLRRLNSRKASTAKQGARHPPLPASSEAQTVRHVRDLRQGQGNSYPAPLQASRTPQSRQLLRLSTHSTDRLLATSPLSERPLSASSETDLSSPLSPDSSPRRYSRLSLAAASTDMLQSVSPVSAHGGPAPPRYPPKGLRDGQSLAIQTSLSTASLQSHPSPPGASESQLSFEMDEREATDVNVVSEHARPGKPKLDKLIADEVEASEGPVVVACCGPMSLNALVRKIVAAQINPGRIRKGDMRGSITLVSEEFEY